MRSTRPRRPARLPALLLGLATGLAMWLQSAVVQAEPALWKVQGPHATVYLFGTVHVLRPTTVWRSPKIDQALKSASSLWIEVANADDPAVMQPLTARYGYDHAHSLSSKLDDQTRGDLNTLLTTYGVPATRLDPMRPWFAGISLNVLPLLKSGYDLNSGVERALVAQARASNTPVMGFETAEQQIRYLAELRPATEIAFLKSSIRDAYDAGTSLDDLVTAWASGDLDTLRYLTNADTEQGFPEIYRLLVVERNQRFAARIAQMLKGEGVTFVAVGAGHLVGPDSVQVDLERMGIQVDAQ